MNLGITRERPVVLYVDPLAIGHRREHLAFYRRVCREVGFRLLAFIPQKLWEATQQDDHDLDGIEFLECAPPPSTSTAAMSRVLDEVITITAKRRIDLIYFPLIDYFVVPIVLCRLKGRRLGAQWSGVYFRDGFNYLKDDLSRPHVLSKSFIRGALLRCALQHGAAGLFTLNEAWKAPMPVPLCWIPDALSSLDIRAAEVSRQRGWPIAPAPAADGGVRLLLFGAMQPRKGLAEVLTALASLDDGMLRKVDLTVLGRFAEEGEFRKTVMALVQQLRGRSAKITLTDRYVPESTLHEALCDTDYVLAPYQDHQGSSGVVGLAAQYGKPVLAQTRYQVGAEVRKWDLGISTDCSDTGKLADAIRRLVDHEVRPGQRMDLFRQGRTEPRARSVVAAAFLQMITNEFSSAADMRRRNKEIPGES